MACFAIGLTQVFGGQGGYLCTDQGEPQTISAQHCHKDSSEQSFTPCPIGSPAPISPDCLDGEGVSQHVSLKVSVEGKSPSASDSVSVPQFIPGFLADVRAFEWLIAVTLNEPGNTAFPSPEEHISPHQSTSVMVAECKVLLV